MYKIIGEKNGNVFVDFRLQGQEQQNALNAIRQEFPDIAQSKQQDKLIEHCLSLYLDQENQAIWRLPHIQSIKAEPDQLNFRAILTRFPDVVLPDNPQTQIDVPEFKAPEETDIQAAIEEFHFRFQAQNRVDRPVDWGDRVTLNMFGRCENELIPNSAQLRFPLLLKPAENGETDPIMSGVIGLSSGDKKNLEFDLPETYHHPAWRGKKATYTIEVMEVREVLLPPLDNDMARHLGFKDLGHLLQSLMAEFRETWKTRWETKLRRLVLQTYVQRAQVNIPDKWIDEALKQEWQATDFERLKQMKAPKEFVLQSLDAWKQQADLKALQHNRLKTKFVLREILKQQDIALTRLDIDKVLSPFANNQQSTEEIYAEMIASGLVNEVSDTLHLEKAVDYIMAQAQLKPPSSSLL